MQIKTALSSIAIALLACTICSAASLISGSVRMSGSINITNGPPPVAAASVVFVQSTQTWATATFHSATFTATTSADAWLNVFLRRNAATPASSIVDSVGNVYRFAGRVGDGNSGVELWTSSHSLAGVTWIRAIYGASGTGGIIMKEWAGISASSPTVQITTNVTTDANHLETSTATISGINSGFDCAYAGSATNGGTNLIATTAGNNYTLDFDFGGKVTSAQFASEHQIDTTDRPFDFNRIGSVAGGRSSAVIGVVLR